VFTYCLCICVVEEVDEAEQTRHLQSQNASTSQSFNENCTPAKRSRDRRRLKAADIVSHDCSVEGDKQLLINCKSADNVIPVSQLHGSDECSAESDSRSPDTAQDDPDVGKHEIFNDQSRQHLDLKFTQPADDRRQIALEASEEVETVRVSVICCIS